MLTIWKYPIPKRAATEICMPLYGKPLTVQFQGDTAVMWALVDPDQVMGIRTFRLFLTGDNINFAEGQLSYIGTIQNQGFVYHLFEIKKGGDTHGRTRSEDTAEEPARPA